MFFFFWFWKAALEWGWEEDEGSPSPRKCCQGWASPVGRCWPLPGKLGTSVWASSLSCFFDKMEIWHKPTHTLISFQVLIDMLFGHGASLDPALITGHWGLHKENIRNLEKILYRHLKWKMNLLAAKSAEFYEIHPNQKSIRIKMIKLRYH